MARGPAEMVAGVRSETNMASSTKQEGHVGVTPRKEGERVFRSKYRSYRLQLITGAPAYRNPISGELIPRKPSLVAQFDENIFKTTDPKVAELIEQSFGYGIGQLCWDVHQVERQAAEATINAQKEALKNPEYRAMIEGVLAQIDGDEFDEAEEEPVPSKAKKRGKPAPAPEPDDDEPDIVE